MRIYVAASFPRQGEARELAERLRGMGCDPRARWLDQVAAYAAGTEDSARAAAADLEDLAAADAVVVLTGDGMSRGGRHAEVGAALAWGKPVLLCGPREMVFHGHPLVTSTHDAPLSGTGDDWPLAWGVEQLRARLKASRRWYTDGNGNVRGPAAALVTCGTESREGDAALAARVCRLLEGDRDSLGAHARAVELSWRLPPSADGSAEWRLRYLALALCGEAGELANLTKKLWRAERATCVSLLPEAMPEIRAELGDVAWYWQALCRALGLDPADVLAENAAKVGG